MKKDVIGYFQTSSALDQPLIEEIVIKINVQRKNSRTECTIYIQRDMDIGRSEWIFSLFRWPKVYGTEKEDQEVDAI